MDTMDIVFIGSFMEGSAFAGSETLMILTDVARYVVSPIICFLGIIANSIGITVLRQEGFKKSPCRFLIILTVADLLYLIFQFLDGILVIIHDFLPLDGISSLVDTAYTLTRIIFEFFWWSLGFICTWIVVIVAYDRYVL